MIVQFDQKYLEELYLTGTSSDKKHRFQPQVIRNYIRRVVTLAEATNIEALYALNSLHYEVLQGNKKGVSSIRIDKQYRLEFVVSLLNDAEPTITVCTLTDLTNHYQ